MVIGLSRMACGRSEWKGMILSTFGGDEDSGLAGPKGFTAERGGSNGTAATLPAARSMSFMRSQKQTAASLMPKNFDVVSKCGQRGNGFASIESPVAIVKLLQRPVRVV
jgi:hypothetical protein